MGSIPEHKIKAIGDILKDSKRPMKERFRALFTLKNIGGPLALEYISDCFSDTSDLLKHELAYCLGQMGDLNAIPILHAVLENRNQPAIVRHEAGEALGALGSPSVLRILENFANDSQQEVAETCQLAVARIEWHRCNKDVVISNPYNTVDPAPPSEETNESELEKILCDEKSSLFDRYCAMFALRNINSEKSISILCKGLRAKSALMRHEIAFVLGQLRSEASVPALIKCLENKSESPMVRHECAEALGAIASEKCVEVLEKYLNDEEAVVRESCEVALDMSEYENTPEFQYANTLKQV